MTLVDKKLDDMEEGVGRAACTKGSHCRCTEVESLLQIVEADQGVDLVPVHDLRFHILAVVEGERNLFIKEKIEKQ